MSIRKPSAAAASTPPAAAPVEAPARPRVGSLVAFHTIDENTGHHRNGHGVVREWFDDEQGNTRAVVIPLPPDSLVLAADELRKA